MQCAGRQIAVIKCAGGVLAFVLYMLDVVAKAQLICAQLAVAAQVILLGDQALQYVLFMWRVQKVSATVNR